MAGGLTPEQKARVIRESRGTDYAPEQPPVVRIIAAIAAVGALAVLAAAAFIGIFVAADPENGWRGTAADYVIVGLSGGATMALCLAAAWLGRVALTGRASRPGWRLILGVPAVCALLLGTIFIR